DAIEISYNNGSSVQTVTRDVQGTASNSAVLTISDGPTYDFGTVVVSSNNEHSFTVDNTGGVTATAISGVALSAPYSFKGGSFPGTGGTCGATLAAAASCSVVVAYDPVTTGATSDTFQINYNDGTGPQNVSVGVQGTAATVALLTISDGPTYDYGLKAVGSTNDHTFTVENTGGVDATTLSGSGLAAPFNFKGGSYPGTGGTCGVTLAPSTNCTVIVTYAPTVAGTHNDTLTINYNDGAAAQSVDRDLQGQGAAAAFLSIGDGPIFDYGTIAVGSTAEHVFSVTNTGGLSATTITGTGLAAPFSFKGGSYPGTGGTCSVSIGPAASCNIVVTYSPLAASSHTDTIQLDYSSGIGPNSAFRDVQGSGATAAVINISDSPIYNYGTLATGSSADHSFTLTNAGGVSATSLAASGLAAPYTFKGGSYPGTGGTCATSLAASATCTIIVTYSPVTT
ncbi:choice-of-anchor D domain-containing protein, partial [Candidatus Saccharibacteria bacterium]|nr:choice-of-anchor D domain-containing protein [Candidatus Saccharibacteria bacterium]